MSPSLSPEIDNEPKGMLYTRVKVMLELKFAPLPLLLRIVEVFLLIVSHLFFNIGIFNMMSFLPTTYLKMTCIPTFKILRPCLGMDAGFMGLGVFIIFDLFKKKRKKQILNRKLGIVFWKDLFKWGALKLKLHYLPGNLLRGLLLYSENQTPAFFIETLCQTVEIHWTICINC